MRARPCLTLFCPRASGSGIYCETSIDGIGTCWPRSSAGQLVARPCPEMFYGVRYNTTSKSISCHLLPACLQKKANPDTTDSKHTIPAPCFALPPHSTSPWANPVCVIVYTEISMSIQISKRRRKEKKSVHKCR